jgi:hypothetical protein
VKEVLSYVYRKLPDEPTAVRSKLYRAMAELATDDKTAGLLNEAADTLDRADLITDQLRLDLERR